VAADPADAVRGADVVLTMLSEGPTVAEVIGQAADGLGDGAIWLQMSTVGVRSERPARRRC
jgi:3-hydroxyisobutyrate dehydrogenase